MKDLKKPQSKEKTIALGFTLGIHAVAVTGLLFLGMSKPVEQPKKIKMVLVTPEGDVFGAEDYMYGEITDNPAGENGFGYDPIFYLPELGKTAAQISPEEKNKISHRGKALRKLLSILKSDSRFC